MLIEYNFQEGFKNGKISYAFINAMRLLKCLDYKYKYDAGDFYLTAHTHRSVWSKHTPCDTTLHAIVVVPFT